MAARNALSVVVDQWRADLVPYLPRHEGRAPLPSTPNLDRLCAEGATFAKHVTVKAPGGAGAGRIERAFTESVDVMPPLFFDLRADPHQFVDRAADPAYAALVRDYAQKALSYADRTLTHYRSSPRGLERREAASAVTGLRDPALPL